MNKECCLIQGNLSINPSIHLLPTLIIDLKNTALLVQILQYHNMGSMQINDILNSLVQADMPVQYYSEE